MKNSYKGAVFFDYDGTLVDERAGIITPTEKTLEAIQRLQQNGYIAVLASGRSKCYAPQSAIKFDALVTANGACTFVGDKLIKEVCFPEELLCEMAQFCDENDICYAVERPQGCCVSDMKDRHFNESLENFNIPKDIFSQLEDKKFDGVHKVFISYCEENKPQQIAERFRDRLEVYPHRFCLSADINLTGVTKATGVRAILQHFGIDVKNSYAFGDGTNDFDMLAAVGHGIAMGIYSEGLEKAAEYVTQTVAEEGIYNALVHYGVI